MANHKRKFSRIYDKNIDKVYRFIFLKVGSQETAEDLCSQVFSKGWDKFRTGQKIDNPSAYLYQIARAEIANYYRWKVKHKTVSTDSVQVVDPFGDIEKKEQALADLADLRANIADLSDEMQNIIIWRFVDDLPIKQVAKLAERPANTVRVMLHRALKEVKKKMEEK